MLSLRWIKEWICSEIPITICTIVKTSQGLKSGLGVISLGDKDQWGLLYHLHYRETCPPKCAAHNLWAISRSKPVQVDCMVSYPLVFIHLRLCQCLTLLWQFSYFEMWEHSSNPLHPLLVPLMVRLDKLLNKVTLDLIILLRYSLSRFIKPVEMKTYICDNLHSKYVYTIYQ